MKRQITSILSKISLWRFLTFVFKKKKFEYTASIRPHELDDFFCVEEKIRDLLRKVEKDLGLPKNSLYSSLSWKITPRMSVYESAWVGKHSEITCFTLPVIRGLVFVQEKQSFRAFLGARIRIVLYFRPYHLDPMYDCLRPHPFS